MAEDNIFGGIPIFLNLSKDELEQVKEIMEIKGSIKGQVLFEAGDPSDAFYVISRGKLRVHVPEDANENRMGFQVVLDEGQFFGEIGVIQSAPRTATVVVEDDSILLCFPKDKFDQLLAMNTDLSEKIMREFSARTKQLSAKVEAKKAKAREKKIFAIYGPSGGAGTTFIACNLAKKIFDYTKKKVALFDGDCQAGTTHIVFNKPNRPEIGRNIRECGEQVTSLAVTSSCMEVSGAIDLMCAPEAIEDSEYFTGEICGQVIRELDFQHDYVVVDTSSTLDERTLGIFDTADIIVVVMEGHLGSSYRLQAFFELIEKLGMQKEILLVLNKEDKIGFSKAEIEEYTKKKLVASIPFDRSGVIKSINGGKLLVESDPQSPCGVALSNLARRLVAAESADLGQVEEVKKKPGGLFSLWGFFDDDSE